MSSADSVLLSVEEPLCLIHAPNERVDPEVERMAVRRITLLAAVRKCEAGSPTAWAARPPTGFGPVNRVTPARTSAIALRPRSGGMTMEIKVGATVVTADDASLGRVAELRAGAFRVDARHQFDYWLDTAIIGEVGPDEVRLLIDENDIGAYKMDHPNDTNEFQSGVPRGREAADVAARSSYEGGSRLR